MPGIFYYLSMLLLACATFGAVVVLIFVAKDILDVLEKMGEMD